MKNYTFCISLLFSTLFSLNTQAQCSGSLSVSATSVLPGTTINATATGWMEDYEWYAEGGTSSQVTWNGNNTWSTSFNTPGVYNLCVAMWCDDWGSSEVQVECVEIVVTNPDGSYPVNANHCDSDEAAPSDLIGDAPLICNLNEHCATTINYCGPDGGCSPDDGINPENVGSWTIENNSWFKFIASSNSACFDIDINCIPSSGVGIQWAIVSWDGSSGVNGFTEMGGQNSNITSLTGQHTICGNGLTPGNIYYLTIDGHSGSLCNYSISVNNGISYPTAPPVVALADGMSPLIICDPLPSTILLTASGGDGTTYNWSYLGSPIGNGSSLTVNLPAVTAGETLSVMVESPSTFGECFALNNPSFSTVNINICTTLPVEMSSFDLSCQRQGTMIKWSTVSENNNDYFLIEKMNSNNVYEIVSTVKSIGNSTSEVFYEYLDNNSTNEITYYRLSQIDFDGTKKILINQSVNCSTEEINIYPNPFKEQLSINLGDFFRKSNGTIEITNTLGQVIYKEYLEKNQVKTTINTQLFSSGVYIVKINSDNHSHIERIKK